MAFPPLRSGYCPISMTFGREATRKEGVGLHCILRLLLFRRICLDNSFFFNSLNLMSPLQNLYSAYSYRLPMVLAAQGQDIFLIAFKLMQNWPRDESYSKSEALTEQVRAFGWQRMGKKAAYIPSHRSCLGSLASHRRAIGSEYSLLSSCIATGWPRIVAPHDSPATSQRAKEQKLQLLSQQTAFLCSWN